MSKIIDALDRANFPDKLDIIHSFVAGSELHGAKGPTCDTDIHGLFIEPPEMILGLDSHEHFVWSTANDSERNTADDVDVTFYGLRKWAGMAAKGNPTALHFLFAPVTYSSHVWIRNLDALRSAMLAKSSAKQFKGFVDAQMGRLLGTKGQGKHGQRPELTADFGYDVKAGMHAVRLLNECIELMTCGTITLPRPEVPLLLKIRAGEFSLDKLSSDVNLLFKEVNTAIGASKLQDFPDRKHASEIISRMYRHSWEEQI